MRRHAIGQTPREMADEGRFHFYGGAFVKTSGFGLMLFVAVGAIIGLT
jgi:hypothetical protein